MYNFKSVVHLTNIIIGGYFEKTDYFNYCEKLSNLITLDITFNF